ncbi:hypothetical protein NRF20_34815 [Streptomyces sp. R-74717]|uniref:hypothetical protein n=1 Tax=Streptomyces sp. R-74717 TaxID=2969820 RepID=UPI0039B393A8
MCDLRDRHERGREAAESAGERVDGPYRFEVIEGAGHWLPDEGPDAVIPPMLDHLAQYADRNGDAERVPK